MSETLCQGGAVGSPYTPASDAVRYRTRTPVARASRVHAQFREEYAIGRQNPAWRRVLDVVVSPPGRGPARAAEWPSTVERRDQAIIGQPPRNVLARASLVSGLRTGGACSGSSHLGELIRENMEEVVFPSDAAHALCGWRIANPRHSEE